MEPQELMIGVLTGSVLILLGLIPGLFHELTEGVQSGIRNFSDSLSSPFPSRPAREITRDKHDRPIWLAGIGASLIALTLMGYFSN